MKYKTTVIKEKDSNSFYKGKEVREYVINGEKVLIEGETGLVVFFQATKITCDNSKIQKIFDCIFYNSINPFFYKDIPDNYLELAYEIALSSNKRFINTLLSKRKNLYVLGIIYNSIKNLTYQTIPYKLEIYQTIKDEYLKNKELIDFIIYLKPLLKDFYSKPHKEIEKHYFENKITNKLKESENNKIVLNIKKEKELVSIEVDTSYNVFKLLYNFKTDFIQINGKVQQVKKEEQKDFEYIKNEFNSWINRFLPQIANVQWLDMPGNVIFFEGEGVGEDAYRAEGVGITIYLSSMLNISNVNKKVEKLKRHVLFNLTQEIKRKSYFTESSLEDLNKNLLKYHPEKKLMVSSEMKKRLKKLFFESELIVNDFLNANEIVLIPTKLNGTFFCPYCFRPVFNELKNKLVGVTLKYGIKSFLQCYTTLLITD